MDQVLSLPDGRTVGYNDYGSRSPGEDRARDHVTVIHCHGGPGSRILDPTVWAAGCRARHLRLVGIDRPGYGLSSPQPGRTIADWAMCAIAVADKLGVGQFLAVGISTGGAYALSLAGLYPERVLGVATGCAMTDMSHVPAAESMPLVGYVGLAGSREQSIARAQERFGENGQGPTSGPFAGNPWSDFSWTDADLEVIAASAATPILAEQKRAAKFAYGVEGYVDDRRADAGGWGSFDVAAVRCPVVIVHGESDTLVPVLAALHTKSLVKQAELRLFPKLGHLSIGEATVAALGDLAKCTKKEA